MTEQLKPCPTPDCTGTVVVMNFRDPKYPERKLLRVTCSCGWSGPMSDDRSLAYAGWNTRPSASREVAVKPLEWGRAEADGMNLQADCAFGRYYIALRADGNWFWRRPASSPAYQGCEKSEDEAKAAAQADYERRILSAIDTTPGNTDPIAKYDDELRKVQGGWRDMDSAPRDGTEVLGRHHKHEKRVRLMWYFKASSMTQMWRDENGNEFKPDAWSPLPTEHPTEQPSVRDAAYAKLEEAACALVDFHNGPNECKRPDIFQRHMQSIAAALRSLAQEGE